MADSEPHHKFCVGVFFGSNFRVIIKCTICTTGLQFSSNKPNISQHYFSKTYCGLTGVTISFNEVNEMIIMQICSSNYFD